MAASADLRPHLEWLGYLQPVGLVVSPLARAAIMPDAGTAAAATKVHAAPGAGTP